MMGTGLAYQQIGAIVALTLIFIFASAIVYRFITSFIHYINHGDFGEGEKSFFVCMMEAEWGNTLKYAFTGYHPGMILADAFFLSLISSLMVVLWAPVIVLGLFLFLARTMRIRIAHKQEFTARLDGTYDND